MAMHNISEKYKKAFLLLAGAVSAPVLYGSDNRPDIILIMADDMGYGDTGFTGNTVIKTPCLDSLAREGAILERFYSAAPVSSPTRASVMTGRHPSRSGVFDANVGILRPEETTIAEILKDNGYSTGFFGKWHLGTLTHTENDANRGKPGNIQEFNPPAEHGFGTVFATESKVPTWDPMKKPADNASGKCWKYIEEGEEWISYGTSYFNENGQKVLENLDGDDSRVIMDRAISFIGKNIKEDKPFIAVIWMHTPHLPCVAGPGFREMYEGSELEKAYAGAITAMDLQVGRLAGFLEQEGVSGNTMIFFCSDNGPENGTPGHAGRFKGRKRSLNEGGIRVPAFAFWPGHIKPGSYDLPCSTSDYLPTICSITGSRTPDIEIDGKSMAPMLLDSGKQESKAIGFVYHRRHAIIDGKYKLLFDKGKTALYDISSDPGETTDLSSRKKGIVKKLSRKYDGFISSCHKSFNGEEYGTESVERMSQDWPYQK